MFVSIGLTFKKFKDSHFKCIVFTECVVFGVSFSNHLGNVDWILLKVLCIKRTGIKKRPPSPGKNQWCFPSFPQPTGVYEVLFPGRVGWSGTEVRTQGMFWTPVPTGVTTPSTVTSYLCWEVPPVREGRDEILPKRLVFPRVLLFFNLTFLCPLPFSVKVGFGLDRSSRPEWGRHGLRFQTGPSTASWGSWDKGRVLGRGRKVEVNADPLRPILHGRCGRTSGVSTTFSPHGYDQWNLSP